MTADLDAAGSLALELSGIKLIEASAGTGKTHAIANLYLRHVLAGRTPAELLVVSFTNAATDELLQRIQKRLYLALNSFNGAETEDEFLDLLLSWHRSLDAAQQQLHKYRLQYALRNMDEAMIATIHGFCFFALQDHALLSHQAFDSEILHSDDALWELALRDWWRRNVYPLRAESWSLLQRAVPGLPRLLTWHRQLRNHPGDCIMPQCTGSLAERLQETADQDDPATIEAILPQITAAALSESRQFATRAVADQKKERAGLAYQDLLDCLLQALQGKAGEDLANRLRRRFPVAMIDEFQDTDPVQYEIFRRLYFDQHETCLTLIGDPKQAIYGFRGGDIFTYIRARNEPGIEIHSLQTNWRSEPALIDAINHLFGHREQAFIYDNAIGFQAAAAAPRDQDERLALGRHKPAPMTIWKLPLREQGKTFGIQEMQNKLIGAVVAEISRLLDPDTGAQIGERILQSGDIAILVRERSEGNALREALAEAGIRAVTIGRDQVFHSSEASGLYDLLDGIAHPRDPQSLRRARACSLFALKYAELAKEMDDDACWQSWVDQLQTLHQVWLTSGFIAMYQQMLVQLELGPLLAKQDSAERRLTNLVHLAELLQQQSRTQVGIDALLAWYRQQIDTDGDDATELRLESEADLIKIVTVHKSKGLEYPVVFLPFSWRCKRASWRASMLRFHDRDGRAWVDVGSAEFDRHKCLAEKERLAEDLRLLYVALTRARSKIYLAWGDAGDGRASGRPMHSALAWLLHSRQTAQDLDQEEPRGFDDTATLYDELDDFAAGNKNLEVVDLPEGLSKPVDRVLRQKESIAVREFSRASLGGWHIGSFSGLTRDVHQVALTGDRFGQSDAILDFPAGSHIGLLLHELLENLDFERPVEDQCRAQIAELAAGYGIHQADQHQILLTWLQQIIDTNLGADGLSLSKLSNAQRLNELRFDFTLDRFDVDAINQLFQSVTEIPLQPISSGNFRGLMTGVIDLVFEFKGRYYLADYKSNLLGANLDEYAPARLQQAMYDRRYDLQAMLYAIALHRYLGQRLPTYDYDRHFGGCFYLFLRALRPESGPAFGVHFELPQRARIEALDLELGFSPDPVASA